MTRTQEDRALRVAIERLEIAATMLQRCPMSPPGAVLAGIELEVRHGLAAVKDITRARLIDGPRSAAVDDASSSGLRS
jgi:hypothetical protein